MEELDAQGLTQQEIVSEFSKMGIEISQQTISLDLAAIRKMAADYVMAHKENAVVEYKRAMSNLHQLRKEVWKHLRTTQNEAVKTHLYGVLENLNKDIVSLSNMGDMVQAEQDAIEARKGLNEAIELESEAVF